MSQETILQLSTAILLLPLLGFIVLIFFNKRLPRQGDWLGTGILFLCLLLSVIVFAGELGSHHDEVLQFKFTWVDWGNVPGIGPLKLELGLMVDNLVRSEEHTSELQS